MLTDFLHTLLQFFEFLWPLTRVDAWERGWYSVFGRVWREVGPGIYPRFPWFIEVHSTSVAWGIANTGRLDITTKDGRILSAAANARCRVVNVTAAMTTVHDHERSVQEILVGVLSERLADVDPDRLKPEGRGRLNASIRAWVKDEMDEFGIEVEWVRFTTFVIAPKTFRLLNEQSVPSVW